MTDKSDHVPQASFYPAVEGSTHQASNLPPGLERVRFLKKAIEAERAIQIEQWLRTPASARQSKGA